MNVNHQPDLTKFLHESILQDNKPVAVYASKDGTTAAIGFAGSDLRIYHSQASIADMVNQRSTMHQQMIHSLQGEMARYADQQRDLIKAQMENPDNAALKQQFEVVVKALYYVYLQVTQLMEDKISVPEMVTAIKDKVIPLIHDNGQLL